MSIRPRSLLLSYNFAVTPVSLPKLRPAAFAIACVGLLVPALMAQAWPPHPSESFITIMKAFDANEYSTEPPAAFQWLGNGERYTVLEHASAPADGSDLVAYDTVTGKRRTVLVTAAQLTPVTAKRPLAVEAYAWSADSQKLLLFTDSRKVWRRNTRGNYWVFDLQKQTLRELGGANAAPSSLMFAKFSPDGRNVAYVRENNLYSENLATHEIRALTTDGSADIINGTSDWVSEEELDIRDAFRWSPDSRSIAFWQFNQHGVQEWTQIDDTSGPVPTTRTYHYPQAGTTNSAVRVGVVDIESAGQISWLNLPGDPREHYVPHMDWVPHTRTIALEYLDRMQRSDRIYLAEAGSDKLREIFDDEDATFVDTNGFHGLNLDFTWLSSQGRPGAAPEALLWFSERDGWRHAYAIPLSGMKMKPKLLTNFAADIIAPVAIDEASRSLYFTSSPDDPIRAYLYRSNLDGSGKPVRLTPPGEKGTHSFSHPSPDGKYAVED